MSRNKNKSLIIPTDLFEALLTCKNELYEVYKQFGGLSNIHLSKGLGAEIDWNFVERYEKEYMHEELIQTVKPVMSIDDITDYLWNLNKAFLINKPNQLLYLSSREIRGRIEDVFDDDNVTNDSLLTSAVDSSKETFSEIVNELAMFFGINFGPRNKFNIYENMTVRDMHVLLDVIKNRMEDD